MAVSGSYKVTFSPDLTEFKGIGDEIRKDLAKATSGLPADFEKMLKEITNDLKGLKNQVKSEDIIDDDGFKEAGDEAGKEFAKGLDDEATKGASGIGSKIGGILAGAGKAAAVGLGAAAVGVGALAGAGLKATAELQQNLGGTDAVFQDNSEEIKKWAAAAAGSMGQTTNEALSTASKMGSLFQGAGHSIEASADMTMGYSQRAADVASVMGVDLSVAMEAVTGAAKGNYDMMDNLGVAMNDTTLANYALEKGMDKSWASMTQAEKTGLAYQLFMEKTAQYAGNFEKENQTLAGSFDILKASWGNVIASMSDPAMLDESLKTFGTSLTNFVGSVSEILPSILQGVVTIIQEILPLLLTTLVDLIPLITGLLTEGLPQIVEAILSALPDLIAAILDGLNQLLPLVLQMLVDIVLKIVEMLPSIIEGLLTIIVTMLPLIIEAIGTIILAIVAILPDLILMIVEALITLIPVLLEGALQLFTAILLALPEIITALVDMLPDLIAMLVETLLGMQGTLLVAAIELFMALVTALPEIFFALQTLLPKIIEALIPALHRGGIQLVKGLAEGFADAWPRMMKSVEEMLGRLWKSFLEFFDIHSPSRLMADTVGFQIGAGVGQGIEDSIGAALSSADTFQAEIYSSFQDGTLDLVSSGDMDAASQPTAGPTVNQYITAQRPESLQDVNRAMRRGALSGVQSLPR